MIYNGNKHPLLAALQSAAGIIERSSPMPIMANVLIESDGNTMALTGSSLDMQISTTMPVTGGEPCAITVTAKKLLDVVKSLPADADVSLKLDEKGMQLKAGKSRFLLRTLPAEEFPKMAACEYETELTMPQGAFKAMLADVSHAMGAQDVRFYLNGALLEIGDGAVNVIATDGHRLAKASQSMDVSQGNISVILPRKAVLELLRQLGDGDEPVNVSIGKGHALFAFGAVEYVTKLIDGKYPDYRRVIPKNETRIIIDRMAMLASLQRVKVLAESKMPGVTVSIGGGLLIIEAKNSEQEAALETIDIDYSGQPVTAGFNVNYLIDAFAAISAEKAEWWLRDGSSIILLNGHGQDGAVFAIMPMRM